MNLLTGRQNKKVTNTDNGYESGLDESKKINSGTEYYCPMKCEGAKRYSEPGNCPVCNMKLIPAEENAPGIHVHKHTGNGHSHHGCC